jgi:hypothetical protein
MADFRKKSTQISNLVRIGPIGAKLFHVDGQTDRHYEVASRSLQFCGGD